MTNAPQEYDIKSIRTLLTAAFTPQELRRFCQDRPTFRSVCDTFGPGVGLADMVDAVIDYCQTRSLWKELLSEVKKVNPGQWEQQGPYVLPPPPSIIPSPPPPSPPLSLPPTEEKPLRGCRGEVSIRNRRVQVAMGIFLSLIVVLTLVGFSILVINSRSCPPDSSRYGFESADILWVKETYPDSQGVTAVSQSNRGMAKLGCYSLKLTVNLEGGHENRSKGEAYVAMDIQNLMGEPITVWVYVPEGAVGQAGKLNGIQVFVKDARDRGEYGTWWNITPEKVNDWHQVTLTPNTSAPPDGYMDPEFDPTLIEAVGVKVAIGEGSTAKYSGPIYIDAIDWP